MGRTIYGFGGLRIASEFPLLELQPCKDVADARCEVLIRHASIGAPIASSVAKFSGDQYSGKYDGAGGVA